MAMNWSAWKNLRSQCILGLSFGLIAVLGTGLLGWLLWLPFPDLRIALIQVALGMAGLLGSLLAGSRNGRWAVYFWFGAALLMPVCSGILWTAFSWLTGLDPLIVGFWLSLVGFSVIFILAIPLFGYVSAKKPTPVISTDAPRPSITR